MQQQAPTAPHGYWHGSLEHDAFRGLSCYSLGSSFAPAQDISPVPVLCLPDSSCRIDFNGLQPLNCRLRPGRRLLPPVVIDIEARTQSARGGCQAAIPPALDVRGVLVRASNPSHDERFHDGWIRRLTKVVNRPQRESPSREHTGRERKPCAKPCIRCRDRVRQARHPGPRRGGALTYAQPIGS
jgi:hypothetical protein